MMKTAAHVIIEQKSNHFLLTDYVNLRIQSEHRKIRPKWSKWLGFDVGIKGEI